MFSIGQHIERESLPKRVYTHVQRLHREAFCLTGTADYLSPFARQSEQHSATHAHHDRFGHSLLP